MKSKWLIEQRLDEEEEPLIIEALKWVLESPECPLCNHPMRKEIELSVFNGDNTSAYIEAKNSWTAGIVEEHMGDHIEFDSTEATRIEKLRDESISTLDMAQDVFGRVQRWLDEWEEKKDDNEGITREWLAEATKLVNAANQSVKLIGTLKKEIGVDSQLLLVQQQVNGVMGIIVDVLRDQPALLNQMELRLGALKAPIHDVDFEVVDE